MSSSDDASSDAPVEAPGWAAIDTWVGSRFGGQVPHQFSSQSAYDLDSASPLPAITVWESKAPPSWLYVGYGLSELFDKSSADPNVSGFGFEFTLRLPRREDEAHPPVWGLRLIQALGREVLQSRAGFDSGHCVDLGGPITPDSDSKLEGLACIPDPLLGKLEGPFGSLLFLRLVGLTRDELEIFKELELGDFVGALAELDASAITDPARASWLDDEQQAKILRRHKLGLKL